METITIASARGFGLADLVVFGVTAVIVGLIAWQVISRMKITRNRLPH